MDRTAILEQLSTGKISAAEAAKLLGSPSQPNAEPLNPNRRLRVRVSNLESGRDRVNVNLPMNLVEAGLKIGARYEPKVADFNLQEILDAVRSGAEGKLVDVENWESGERVEVFID
jgi:hypothetical protein